MSRNGGNRTFAKNGGKRVQTTHESSRDGGKKREQKMTETSTGGMVQSQGGIKG